MKDISLVAEQKHSEGINDWGKKDDKPKARTINNFMIKNDITLKKKKVSYGGLCVFCSTLKTSLSGIRVRQNLNSTYLETFSGALLFEYLRPFNVRPIITVFRHNLRVILLDVGYSCEFHHYSLCSFSLGIFTSLPSYASCRSSSHEILQLPSAVAALQHCIFLFCGFFHPGTMWSSLEPQVLYRWIAASGYST